MSAPVQSGLVDNRPLHERQRADAPLVDNRPLHERTGADAPKAAAPAAAVPAGQASQGNRVDTPAVSDSKTAPVKVADAYLYLVGVTAAAQAQQAAKLGNSFDPGSILLTRAPSAKPAQGAAGEYNLKLGREDRQITLSAGQAGRPPEMTVRGGTDFATYQFGRDPKTGNVVANKKQTLADLAAGHNNSGAKGTEFKADLLAAANQKNKYDFAIPDPAANTPSPINTIAPPPVDRLPQLDRPTTIERQGIRGREFTPNELMAASAAAGTKGKTPDNAGAGGNSGAKNSGTNRPRGASVVRPGF